jgi:sphingomyelin phosphodiesterase
MNIALFNETGDASHQLKWLRSQLSAAEKENRLIILAAHIAPGCYTCVNKWAERYNVLYERYQHIIRLAVFGHDHRELYEIVRSTTTHKPIGVHYVTGSLGTYFYVNPSVRLFKMHAKHHLPIQT